MRAPILAAVSAALACVAFSAQAALTVSAFATRNVACVARTCTATAAKAVLNAADLESMLAGSSVTLVSGSIAGDIVVAHRLSWSTASTLTLDSHDAIVVGKPVLVQGSGGVTLTTNDGGAGGTVRFDGRNGYVRFSSLASALAIDGASYTLVHTVAGMAGAIQADPNGHYALARNYNARRDGTYAQSPIASFNGRFQGLGNIISNVTVSNADKDAYVGFFGGSTGTIEGLNLRNVSITATGTRSNAGGLLGANGGKIRNSSVTGSVNTYRTVAGGFVGDNEGFIDGCQTFVAISTELNHAGGFVGFNGGTITRSFSSGSGNPPGFVGQNRSFIDNSYSNAAVTSGSPAGFAGDSEVEGAFITASYASGPLTVTNPDGQAYGFAGATSNIDDCYWDTTTTGTTHSSRGSSATGLTDEEFKAGLPEGFDPAIWAEAPSINDGLPYLIGNKPR